MVICEGCSYGLSVSSSNLCVAICGDGVAFANEECDDGNILDRDGCSSSCFIEDYFSCNTTVNPS